MIDYIYDTHQLFLVGNLILREHLLNQPILRAWALILYCDSFNTDVRYAALGRVIIMTATMLNNNIIVNHLS